MKPVWWFLALGILSASTAIGSDRPGSKPSLTPEEKAVVEQAQKAWAEAEKSPARPVSENFKRRMQSGLTDVEPAHDSKKTKSP